MANAVIAMIAKAIIGQDPFQEWGDGNQVRNQTYANDIVQGTALVEEAIGDCMAVNPGTMEGVRVMDAAKW